MCALPSRGDRSLADPEIRVTGCERADVGANSSLVRVTVAVGRAAIERAGQAQLVVLIDNARERGQRPLPAPARSDATELTLGFAVTRRAEVLALDVEGCRLALPAPVVRSPRTLALVTAGARPSGAAADPTEQLRTTRVRLEEAHATSARLEAERDRAQAAAARAEAAAHDATARADALAAVSSQLPVDERRPGRSPRRTAAAACAIGSAALVCGILVWPGGDGAGNRGVSGVGASTPPSSSGSVRTPALFDALAQRLRIPAAYLVLYRQAGARYGLGWTRLAAIGAIESRHGQAVEAGVASGANHRGASGPAQFLAGTWERFGVDGDGDGTRDPHDPADAIAAMASYLRASGAPQDWRGALRTYNQSDDYAAAVEQLAATYRRRAN